MGLKILSIDPSFNNVGWAYGEADSLYLDVTRIGLFTTRPTKNKKVKKSSDDWRRANELTSFYLSLKKEFNPDVVVAEQPAGSQSARASWALGIALGTLTSLAPVVMFSAYDVKKHITGDRHAEKSEIIEWATGNYPHLDWIKGQGKILLSPRNEHPADAVAIMHTLVFSESIQSVLIREEISAR